MSVSQIASRRKIITTSRKVEWQYPQVVNTHHDEVDFDLRPNLHIARTTFAMITTENRSVRLTKSISEKPLLVPSKQNIDYSQLFQRKLVGLKGSKVTSFLINNKSNKKGKDFTSEEVKVKQPASPIKHLQKKIQSLKQKKVDICAETVNMLKGLNERDLDAFLLLLSQSQQSRKKKAINMWQTFHTQKFLKNYYSKQQQE